MCFQKEMWLFKFCRQSIFDNRSIPNFKWMPIFVWLWEALMVYNIACSSMFAIKKWWSKICIKCCLKNYVYDDPNFLKRVITGANHNKTKSIGSGQKSQHRNSKPCSIKCQCFAHCFLRLPRRGASGVYTRFQTSRIVENCFASQYWRKTTTQSCLSHHIHRIPHHVTFYVFNVSKT